MGCFEEGEGFMNAQAQERINRFEVPAMRRTFPQFRLYLGDGSFPFTPRGCIFWGGTLRTNFDTEYNVAVVYPNNYPHDQIRAYVKELLNVVTPHKYPDGHLCL